jgi:excisionase family DNA binding protein
VRGNLPLLLSAEQVAAELGMSTSWVRKHISAERIPVQHLGRNVRIHRVTLPELAENGLDREMQ